MKLDPNQSARVTPGESLTLTKDATSVSIFPMSGDSQTLGVSDNTISVPLFETPNKLTLKWSDGESEYTTYIELVDYYYFPLEALKNYGDGQDEFSELSEEELFAAREAATEIIERNACRSFVHRVGRTKDFGVVLAPMLDHGDVYELLTDGYKLMADNIVTRLFCKPFPVFIEYKFGYDHLPAEISRAALELAAYMLRPSNRPIGATGESTDAGFIRFTTAGQDGFTDIPEVNAAIQQFGRGQNWLM